MALPIDFSMQQTLPLPLQSADLNATFPRILWEDQWQELGMPKVLGQTQKSDIPDLNDVLMEQEKKPKRDSNV